MLGKLAHIVDIMRSVNAGACLIEAANPRHEHEYVVWGEVELPEGKNLILGVIPTRSTMWSIRSWWLSASGGRSHPQIAWAKLTSLVASRALRY